MKRIIFILMLLIMVFTLLDYGLAADAKYEFLIKACVPTVSGEPPTIAMQRFAELVEEKSRGRIKFEVYIGGALGNDRDLIEGLQLGTVQVHMASNSPLAVFVPEMMIFEMPKIIIKGNPRPGKAASPALKAFSKLNFFPLDKYALPPFTA